MANISRARFAYAPLRQADQLVVREVTKPSVTDWYDGLSERSLAFFDAVSITTFALAGLALTWYARHWMPIGWWATYGNADPLTLSVLRISLAFAAGLVLFVLACIGSRIGVLDLPRENFIVLAAKFAVVAMLGCGMLFVYRDPSLGFAPMVGLSVIGLVLLFRMEPLDALKAALVLATISLPMMYTAAAI